MANELTAEDILNFFQAHGLHISDGCDPCSGTDSEAEEKAAAELAERIANLTSKRPTRGK